MGCCEGRMPIVSEKSSKSKKRPKRRTINFAAMISQEFIVQSAAIDTSPTSDGTEVSFVAKDEESQIVKLKNLKKQSN